MGKVDVAAGRHRGTHRILYVRPNPEIRESLTGPRTNTATTGSGILTILWLKGGF